MLKTTTTAALVATLFAGASQAATFQTSDNTKFNVNVDVGAYYLSKKNADGKAETQIAGKGINQIQIKGESKLADGVKVFGQVELDFDPVKNNDTAKTDDIKLGVEGSFGKLTVGQWDSFAEDNVFETLGVGHGETGFVTEPASGNDGRHVQYSNKFGNLAFGIDLTHSASSADGTKTGMGTALGVTYKLDQLTLGLATDTIAKYVDDTGAESKDKSTTGVSAKYKMGNATLLAMVATTKPVTGTDKTKYSGVGVTYDMGAINFGLAYQRVKTGSTSRNETSAGVSYEAYKNMTVYLDMANLGQAKSKGNTVEMGVAYKF